jgi:serine/threonine protein kinase/Tfp pilus assembly protein PilF
MSDLAGTTISHYRIIERVGQGGMGDVYKAEDTKLNNFVALKFLPAELSRDEEAKQRFLNEARAARKLEHPNICTIYDIDETGEGQVFISMPFYEGGTLEKKIEKGSLSESEAVETALKIAEALNKAHREEIVHRDIKPSNIMFTKDGTVKVVDFGLAKMAGVKITKTGTTMGTLAYMSPEQLRGEETDHQTDIWALGVLLYEMLTGHHPFQAENEQAMFFKILNEPIKKEQLKDLPPLFAQIITKALNKEAEDRYQDIEKLIVDLQQFKIEVADDNQTAKNNKRKGFVYFVIAIVLISFIAAYVYYKYFREIPPEIVSTKSIAVLPLKNLSADVEQEYFADGITEEIIGDLGKIGKLRVISFTSTLQYKNIRKTIPEISNELDVQYIVEGSIQSYEGKVRITAKLMQASPESLLWSSDPYDADQKDILSLISEVSQSIAEKIVDKLTAEEQKKLENTYAVIPYAYRLYLNGRSHWNKRTPESLAKSIELFQQAIEADSSLAPAYSGLADALALFGSLEYGVYPPAEVMPRAKAAALKAIQLDPLLAEGHTSLANIYLFYDWNWTAARKEFEKAIDLYPSYATAHHWYGTYFVTLGKFNKAFEEINTAFTLDPNSRVINVDVGWFYQYARKYDKAIQNIQTTIQLEPDFVVARLNLGFTYALQKKYDEAIQSFRKARELSGDYPLSLAALSYSLAVAGKKGEALELLSKLDRISKKRYVPSLYFALIYMGLGDNDQAFHWIEKGIEERSGYLLYFKVDPKVDKLRSDSRFKELLGKIGFK